MRRRDFLKVIGASALLPSTGCSLDLRTNSPKKPNIILCMADDQGWGDMGYYGHPVLKTPHFDAMAAEALRFDRFYAATPVCTPTRGSVLTGRHPNRFGCFTWGSLMRPQEITIAKSLRTEGYVTGHFGKWHLGSVFKDSPVNPGAMGFDEWVSSPNFFDLDPVLSDQGVAKPFSGDSSDVTVDVALDFIRRHSDSERPFLAVVWFGSPHVPHEAIMEDAALYADHPEDFESHYGNTRHFYGEITAMDRAFGRLRTELRSLGIHENTILWYCSDNGGLPQLGVTGGREAKGSVYEGGLRVPALLEWPARIQTPRISNIPANTSDIFPTLLEVVGAEPAPRPLDGISLLSLIDGKMKTRPKPMGFWQYPAQGRAAASKALMKQLAEVQAAGKEIDNPALLHPDAAVIDKQYPTDTFPGHAAWLDWPWKLHRIQKEDGTTTLELYHLADDPMESADAAADHPERVASMKSQMEAWFTSVVSSLNGEDYTHAPDTPASRRMRL